MKIRPLFKKYQKYLVAFANSRIGHLYLKTENLPVVKVTPDGIHYASKVKNGKVVEVKAVFYSRSPYLKKFDLALTSMEIASESFNFLKSFDKPDMIMAHFLGLDTTRLLPVVMLATGTFYPDANPEVTSVDGTCSRYVAAGETWATIRAATGTGAEPSTADIYYTPYLETKSTGSGLYVEMDRTALLFDTSSLGAGAIVSGAVLSPFGSNSANAGVFNLGTAAQRELCVVGCTPASNTNLVTGDYAQFGTTKYATDFASTSWTKNAYNDITLNATGIAAIAVNGVTKIGLRMGADCDNSEPTWSGGLNNAYGIIMADNGSNKPKLVITYTPAPGGGSPMLFGGGVTIG